MQVFTKINELKNCISNAKNNRQRIGFVPTMGALHQGHLSLIQQSKQENDLTVCSIFVNPSQFNNTKDFQFYPRTVEADTELLKSVNCDILFLPSVDEIYPSPSTISIDFGYLNTILEGEFRPGHFSGVGIIVSKLLNIVSPHKAYFGEKDLQQCIVIETLVNDLAIDVEIIRCEIMREKNGLAMSSRNQRLSEDQKNLASNIYKTLQIAQKEYTFFQNQEDAISKALAFLNTFENIKLEYLEIVSAKTLLQPSITDRKIAICIAVYIGDVRLIDNLTFNV